MQVNREDDTKDYLWLVKTDKGDFFITVIGNWTQELAEEKVRLVLQTINLSITAMIPRKRVTGTDESMATIYQGEKAEEFQFLAAKRLWYACGRGAEYEAELIRSKKEG